MEHPVDRDRLDGVQTELTYPRRSPEEKGPDLFLPRYEIPFVKHETTIRDARPIVDELSLDREGFILVKHKTAVADIRDPDVMREKFLEEMIPFIQDYFKASRVEVPSGRLAATLRTEAGFGFGSLAHLDYSPSVAAIVAAREEVLRGRPLRVYSRLMIIQAWRALSPPPQDIPLAFCDTSTIAKSDVQFETQRVKGEPENIIISGVVRFNPNQRWYYFPNMVQDELILFKGYDSDRHNDVFSTHSAFDNRHTFPDANPRASVEGRFYVYYD